MEYSTPGTHWGQCGAYTNKVLNNYDKGKWFGDSISQKLSFINSNTPVAGAAIIIETGHTYGHVGIVKKVYEDWKILVNDSNLVATETVWEYTLDPNNPTFPSGKTGWKISGYYIPYAHYFDIIVDTEWNWKVLREVKSNTDIRIWLVGNHWHEPSVKQLNKVREVVKSLGIKAYEKQDSHCTQNFNSGMLSRAFELPVAETCNSNQCELNSKCFDKPENSECSDNGEDAWICQDWFEESWYSCVVEWTAPKKTYSGTRYQWNWYLSDWTDLDRLAYAVSVAETGNCTTGAWASRRNNCFGIMSRPNGVRTLRSYPTTEASFDHFKDIWSRLYGSYPNMALAEKWTWKDNAHHRLRIVNSKY